MPDPTFVTTMLALFASAEKAGEIHGDLLEERVRHGLLWYCLQVPFTCAMLALEALRRQPVLLLMAYALYELALKLNWWVLRPLYFATRYNEALPVWQQVLLSDLLRPGLALVFAAVVTWFARSRAAVLLLSATAMLLVRDGLFNGLQEALELVPVVVPMVLAAMLLVRWWQLRAAVRSGAGRDKRLQGS